MSNQEKLRQCFHEAFDLASDVNVEGLSYEGEAVWDSVGHMRLVAAIETKFSIMFTTDQILDMSSFAKAREIVGQHGVSLET